MKKRLSGLISVIVSAAIVFSLIPKIFGTERVRAEESYNIWVGGIQVTGANKDNILYDKKASVKFDPDTYTLTLNEPENMGFYPEIGKEAIVYIGDLGHDITICGKADLVSSGSYYYAVYSDFDSVKVTLNGYFSSGKTFIVNNMNVTGGHIKTDVGIHTEKFNMTGGKIDASYFTGMNCWFSGGSITANNSSPLINSGAGIACTYLVISDGTVNTTGDSCGILTSRSMSVSGGNVTSHSDKDKGIISYGTIDIIGGEVTATGLHHGIYAQNDIGIYESSLFVVAHATSETDGIAIASKSGTIILDDGMECVESATAVAEPYDKVSSAIYSKKQTEGGKPLSKVTITNAADIFTVTYKDGAGLGGDIVERRYVSEEFQLQDFPSSEWKLPAGKHFYCWSVTDNAGTNEEKMPLSDYTMYRGDAIMTAVYFSCITGWEDTGEGGIKEIGDTSREIKASGSENSAFEGDSVEIEIKLKDDFAITDNKIEVLSAASGKTISDFTVSYNEKSDSLRGSFKMPGEDVTLRFATKKNDQSSSSSSGSDPASTTVDSQYVIVKGANGTWDGVNNYIVEVSDKAADDTILDRYRSASVDGHQLGDGEHVIRKGSVIVEITSDYLKTLSAGEHTIVVAFSDKSVSTTITVSAAASSSTSAASIPSTGETIATTYFAGVVFVLAACGFCSAVAVKKRKEEI